MRGSDTSVSILTFYRLVRTDPPTIEDFKSHRELGIPSLDDDPEHVRMRAGISVHLTEAQSRAKARSRPWFGRFIARMQFANDGMVHWERTGGGRGHHTLWAEPAVLLSCTVEIIPV